MNRHADSKANMLWQFIFLLQVEKTIHFLDFIIFKLDQYIVIK